MRTPKPQPTAEQIAALVSCAARNGQKWKWKLNLAWQDGNYRRCDCGDIYPLLQQVRNQFGPTWLHKFNLAKALEAAK